MYIRYTHKEDSTNPHICELSSDLTKERQVSPDNSYGWYKISDDLFVSWGRTLDVDILTEDEFFLECL